MKFKIIGSLFVLAILFVLISLASCSGTVATDSGEVTTEIQ